MFCKKLLLFSLIGLSSLYLCSSVLLALSKPRASASAQPTPKKITVDDNYVYIDGERFFVKGLGYSPIYPGEHHSRLRMKANVAEDLKHIRDLGANTIVLYRREAERVYREARKQGLMILQGIWMEQAPDDFHDERFKKKVKRKELF